MISAAVDRSIWRVVGSPLVAGASSGPLRGESVAVKDLFDVAGFAVGAGVPAYLAESRPATASAPAVAALLAAGADMLGIAQTDEFAYSIAGRNFHYGTPPNVAVPGSIPGGSSSGPASAVALGQVSIGLGTDTAGSIRVPASYQGLWGLRTSHGAIDTAGLLPLARSFDAVGWLTRSSETLLRAAATSLDGSRQVGIPAEVVIAPAVRAEISPAYGRPSPPPWSDSSKPDGFRRRRKWSCQISARRSGCSGRSRQRRRGRYMATGSSITLAALVRTSPLALRTRPP